MGLLDIFKKEEKEEAVFDKKKLYKSLINSGISEVEAEDLTDTIWNKALEQSFEQGSLSLENAINIFEQNAHSVYSLSSRRYDICQEIKEFVRTNIEILQSVRIYGSYIAYGSADLSVDDYYVKVISSSEEKRKLASEKIEKFERQSKLKKITYKLATDLVKYNDAFLLKIYNIEKKLIGVEYLPSEEIEIIRDSNNKPIKYIRILKKEVVTSKQNNDLFNLDSLFENDEKSNDEISYKIIEYDPKKIVHFSSDYLSEGENLFTPMIVTYKVFKLLEESIAIHRITRSRRLIAFFLDVTGKKKEKIRASIHNFTENLANIFSFNTKEGNMFSKKSKMKIASEIVIPVTKDSATKIQPIPSDNSATSMNDLEFYIKRMLSNLLTAHIFVSNLTNYMYMERAFLRAVRIYQKHLAYELEELFKEVLESENIDVDIIVNFPSPNLQDEMTLIEIIVRRLMVITQIASVLDKMPPKEWIIKYVFKDLSTYEINELIEILNKPEEETTESEEETFNIFENPPNTITTQTAQEQQKTMENNEITEEKLISLIENKLSTHEKIMSTIDKSLKVIELLKKEN